MLKRRTVNEFRDEVVRFGRALGFDTVSAVAVIDRGIGRSDFVVVDNTPAGVSRRLSTIPARCSATR